MKIFLFYILISFLFSNCHTNKPSQTNIVLEQNSQTQIADIIGSWVEARKDESGNFVPAPASRGGWYSLDIIESGEVSFNGSMNCGFGEKRLGRWTLNEDNTIINFDFTIARSYRKSTPDKIISLQESYHIVENSVKDLVLKSLLGDEKTLTFRKS